MAGTFGTFVAGTSILVADMNARHGGRWRRVANQSLTTATLTAISWDTEDADTDAFAAVSFSTLTIPTGLGGNYSITAALAGLGGTAPTIRVVAGGFTFDNPGSLFSGAASITVVVPVAAAATIVVSGYQNSGGSLNVTGSLFVVRLGA